MEENLIHSNSGSCSPFWITNIVMSFINGRSSRKKQLEDATDDLAFQARIAQMKEDFEDAKAELERSFKLSLAERKNDYSDIQTQLKLDLDKEKDELRMFIKGWPLKLSLQAVQNLRLSAIPKSEDERASVPSSLYIIVANHAVASSKGDPLGCIYDGNGGIVDSIQSTLEGFGIPPSRILRFKEGSKSSGGAALGNIFSMMSTFPSVVIMPRVDNLNRKLLISAGYWYPGSQMPSQRKVFVLDYDTFRMVNSAKYKEEKQKEIENCYTSIAAVMNDCYALITAGKTPLYPSYAADNGIPAKYPHINAFMRGEYASLLDDNETTVMINGHELNAANFVLDDKSKENITKIIDLL